jgi:hypothetical protein
VLLVYDPAKEKVSVTIVENEDFHKTLLGFLITVVDENAHS